MKNNYEQHLNKIRELEKKYAKMHILYNIFKLNFLKRKLDFYNKLIIYYYKLLINNNIT